MIAAASYLQADVTSPDDLRRILTVVTGLPALYFALPPRVTIAACAALEKVGLPKGTVLGLEKPFGTDLRSAQELNRQLLNLVPQRQIRRVDHFLGKSTVLNLLGLRFTNRIFEQVWNADNIERVDVIFDEALALEGRAGVLFGLRSGKALADKRQEIFVTFTDVPHRPYGFSGKPGPTPDRAQPGHHSARSQHQRRGELSRYERMPSKSAGA